MPIRLFGAALLAATLTLVTGPLRAGDSPALTADRANPELQHFVRAVVAANPEIQAARAALDASAALRDAAARPLYNPELDAELERSADDARTLGISQTLDWNGSARRAPTPPNANASLLPPATHCPCGPSATNC